MALLVAYKTTERESVAEAFNSNATTIGVAWLGTVGAPMAERLAKTGYEIIVHDLERSSAIGEGFAAGSGQRRQPRTD